MKMTVASLSEQNTDVLLPPIVICSVFLSLSIERDYNWQMTAQNLSVG
jgi:hypothetical protein